MKKRLIPAVVAAVFCMAFSGCKYTSSYSANMLVQTSNDSSATMSFSEFEGTKSFTLKAHGDEPKLKYTGMISSGSASVYYDFDGAKTELFSLGENESIDSSVSLPKNATVYVIIETTGKCKEGAFSFATQ